MAFRSRSLRAGDLLSGAGRNKGAGDLPMMERLKHWAHNLKASLIILWFAKSHPDTPLVAKACIAMVVAYAFSPIDLIPDFIPVLGYLDDLVLVPLGIYLALRLIPPHVFAESRAKAEEWLELQKGRPKNYAAAAVIVLVWLGTAAGAWCYWLG